MNAAALAICGAAWLGGVAAVVGTARPNAAARLAAGAGMPFGLTAVAVFLALGSLPALVLAESGSTGPSAVNAAIGATGLAAAGLAAWLAGRDDPGAPAADRARDEGLDSLAVLLAAAAAAVAGAGATSGGVAPPVVPGSLPFQSPAPLGPDPAALGAGLGMAVAALPAILFGTPTRRLPALAIAIAGAGFVDRGAGPWTPAVALIVPAFGAGVIGAARAVAPGERSGRRTAAALAAVTAPIARPVARTVPGLDARLARAAVVAGPALVGLAGAALLASTDASSSGARAAALLVVTGGFGLALSALAALADVEPRRWRDAVPLVPVAASVPVAALGLRLADPVAGALAAGLALALASTARPHHGHTPLPSIPMAAPGLAGTALAVLGLVVAGAPTASDGAHPLGRLAVAIGVALALGAVPFHRAVRAVTDSGSPSVAGITLGWLPAVVAAVAIRGEAVAGTSAPLDASLTAIVVAVAVPTIVLGAVASAVQDDLRHALAYLVASQGGWVVLGFASAGAGMAATASWLPAFAIGAIVLGAVATLLSAGPGADRPADVRGFGRRRPVALVGLGAGFVSLVGLPATAAWQAHEAIAAGTLGLGPGADLLVVVGALAAIPAVARIALAALRAPAGGIRARAAASAAPRHEIPSAVASGAVALLAIGALSLGLGIVR